MGTSKTVEVKWPGREEVTVTVGLDDNSKIISAEVRGIGGPIFLQYLSELRAQLPGNDLKSLKIPAGRTREDIFLRETILKLKDEWNFPYKDSEVCHCRVVATDVVDQAVCAGAHTAKKVSQWTSASTACGTCRPDVEAIIQFRLNK